MRTRLSRRRRASADNETGSAVAGDRLNADMPDPVGGRAGYRVTNARKPLGKGIDLFLKDRPMIRRNTESQVQLLGVGLS